MTSRDPTLLERVAKAALYAMPLSGFEFSESVSGTHRFVERRRDRGEMPFSFSMRAFTDELKVLLDPASREFFRLTIEGTVSMEGLAVDAPFSGTLEASIVRKRQLIYDFNFKASGGVLHRFWGHKDLSIFQPFKSVTTLYGEVAIAKTGKVISTSVSYLDARDLPGMLGSLRLR